jgi:hypothetical protein
VRRKGFTEHRWLRERDLAELPCATVTRKAIDALRTPLLL